MTSHETLRELEVLIIALIKLSLCNEQNFPSTSGEMGGNYDITVNNAGSLTIALKNMSYKEIYTELEKAKCFNAKMLDGALMVLRYRFRNGNVCEHSLSYFPSPDLEAFQNEPEVYIEDEVYAEFIAKSLVPFPVRFDFSDDPDKFIEIDHPYSHMTLGQFRNCRIPVCSPVSPLTFGSFVLRNFYNTVFHKYSDDLPASTLALSKTITTLEKSIPHIVLGAVPV